MCVVMTFRVPPLPGSGPPNRPPNPRICNCFSQAATESPCHCGSPPFHLEPSKWNKRVCVPASVSIFSVWSSAQVTCSRVGRRRIPAAPYALHWSPSASSLAGFQSLPALRPASFSGTLAKSPLGGVTMRHRQSSSTIETQ